MSLYPFCPLRDIFGRNGRRVLGDHLEDFRQKACPSQCSLTFSFTSSAPWENMRAAEFFNSASFASISSHFLLGTCIRYRGHVVVRGLFGRPRTSEVVSFPRAVPQAVSSSSFPNSPLPKNLYLHLRSTEDMGGVTYLYWPEVVGGCHKVLAEDGDPFDVSLPFGLETSRGHGIRWLQKGAEKRRICHEHGAKDR